jgi:hypothetical protein
MEDEHAKIHTASVDRVYTYAIKREGAESFELFKARNVPYYSSPEAAQKGGEEFIEFARNSSNILRGPYTGQEPEQAEVCVVDITSFIDARLLPRTIEEQEKLARERLQKVRGMIDSL